ncbi:MAG: hypothetical protein M0R77_11905 [Gammaproteobacteria bacterium]|nr:hypothetical protein [Gammaproteobacteria bacterium]
MANRYAPETGNWYKDETGASFEVILVDEGDATVDVQYFDGSVESFDMETWEEMELTRRAPPEDWSGPFDDLDADDLDTADSAARARDWSDPLDMEFED